MKRYVEIEPVCPFLGGKPCIADGWKWDATTLHPCAFYDADMVYNGNNPEQPCRIKRAINRLLSDEVPEQNDDDKTIEVPFATRKE